MKNRCKRVEQKSTKTKIVKRKRAFQGLQKVVEEECVNKNLWNNGTKYFIGIYKK